MTPAALFVIGITAFAASALTLFAGFGLGTLLLPVFAVFFPAEVAVAATAVVHGLNSLFKAVLVGRHADRRIVLRFGIPAVAAALAGAALLAALSKRPPVRLHWPWGAEDVPPVQIGMGILILLFAIVELVPERRVPLRLPIRWLPIGGLLSGFFGGLSGHQGALRAIFLRRAGLGARAFAGTQAILALLVDTARLLVYGAAAWGRHFGALASEGTAIPVVVGTLCAFGGAYAGTRLFPKMTIGAVQKIVGLLLIVTGAGLASGLL